MSIDLLTTRAKALQYASDIARDHGRAELATQIDDLCTEINEHIEKRIGWDRELHFLRGYEAGVKQAQIDSDSVKES
jgi:hypothetical protein